MNGDATIQEVMGREFVGASESDGLLDTVELMLTEDTECVVVLRGNDPVGVMTERDVLSLLVEDDPEDATVADAMTETIPTVDPGMTVAEAADVMSTEPTKRLLVTDGDELMGVLTEHDVLTTSPFAPGSRESMEAEQPMTSVAGDVRTDTPQATAGSYEEQSICEACGSLTRDLVSFNGQLLCSDCRDI